MEEIEVEEDEEDEERRDEEEVEEVEEEEQDKGGGEVKMDGGGGQGRSARGHVTNRKTKIYGKRGRKQTGGQMKRPFTVEALETTDTHSPPSRTTQSQHATTSLTPYLSTLQIHPEGLLNARGPVYALSHLICYPIVPSKNIVVLGHTSGP